MWAIVYEDKISKEVILECCFNSQMEKRRLHLEEESELFNIQAIHHLTGLYSFFACLVNKQYVVDYLPTKPVGEYRI